MLTIIKKLIRKASLLLRWNTYQTRVNNEIKYYKDCHQVHELPDIFHYWSNKYLLPKVEPFGFNSPDNFFFIYCKKQCLKAASAFEKQTEKQTVRILSIGSGNGELEIDIAVQLVALNITNFNIHCLDINQHMLERTLAHAQDQGVAEFIVLERGDFNKWSPHEESIGVFDVVMANQSLHHVLKLEHLFDSIYRGLSEDGIFLTSDMIGRNGHMRWPEALRELKPFWDELPNKYKYNHLHLKQQNTFVNHDCSKESFEGIRAQDILPLLIEKFNFQLFIPFANLITIFIDRPYGHNFDINDPKDIEFIDRVHERDEHLILQGTIKPTQMMAVMTKSSVTDIKLVHPALTPEHCVRMVQ